MLSQLCGPSLHIPSEPKRDRSTVGRWLSESSLRKNEANGRMRDSLRRRARATLTRIPKSHVLSEERPSNRSRLRKHVSHASWTTSSATPRSPPSFLPTLHIPLCPRCPTPRHA